MPHNGFPSGYFKIQSRISGKCLDITKEHSITAVDGNSSTAQHWYADMAGRVVNRLRGLVLSAKKPTNGAGVNAEVLSKGNNISQQWYVDDTGRIISKGNGKSITFDKNNKSSMIPVYIWENYNGPSQKWYFKGVDSDITKRLLKSQHGFRVLPGDVTDISEEQTYQCWVKLSKFQSGRWKRIFSRGKHSAGDLGVWILPDRLQLQLCVNGTCTEISYEVPLDAWFNVCLILYSKHAELYADGISRKKLKLSDVYTPSTEILRVGSPDLYIKELEYSNTALHVSKVKDAMNSSNPNILHVLSPGSVSHGGSPAGTPQEHIAGEGVTIIAMSANGTHPDCGGPYNGRLNQYGWCASSPVAGYYLQLDLDKVYRVTKILTQGRSTGGQWVTSYELQYLDSKGQYINYGQTLPGNTDPNEVKQNDIEITTKTLRVYPKSWFGWPSMRVGLDGTPDHSYKCTQYLELSTTDKTPMGRKMNLDSYNQECRKISYYDHLQALHKYKSKLDKVQELHLKSSDKCRSEALDAQKLQDKVAVLQRKINGLKLDLELAKSIKCPPSKVCLPVINPISNKKTASINDFDIRTHKNFYQYVPADSVKPCSALRDTGDKDHIKELEDKLTKLTAQLTRTQLEASRCESNFDNKIYPNNIDMNGGGIYGKICSLTTMGMGSCKDIAGEETSVVNEATVVDTSEFKPICKRAIKPAYVEAEEHVPKPIGTSEECRPAKTVAPSYVEHAFQEDYSITKHKDFNRLMKNYMLKSQCTARGAQPPEIAQHPQYPDLMNKYALRDTGTCPPTYKPCPANVIKECQALKADIKLHPQYNGLISGDTATEHAVEAKRIKKILSKASTPEQKREVLGSITDHPDIVNYVPVATARSACKAAIHKARSAAPACPANSDITQHPGYPGLMKTYAIRDTTTCPPVYKPCPTPPDLSNYVRKSQFDSTAQQLAEIQRIAQRQQAAIGKLKDAPIEAHPQYPALVQKLSDLNKNPNIHKYILKTQIPALLDRECRTHFRGT